MNTPQKTESKGELISLNQSINKNLREQQELITVVIGLVKAIGRFEYSSTPGNPPKMDKGQESTLTDEMDSCNDFIEGNNAQLREIRDNLTRMVGMPAFGPGPGSTAPSRF